MASSGSFLTNGWYDETRGDYVYLEFAWQVASTSLESNSTTISWELRGKRTASGYYVNAGGFKVVIDGTTVYSKSTDYRIKLYKGTVVASGTHILYHDPDGDKTFSASAEGGIYTYAVNCTGSGKWTLPDIPKKLSTLEVKPATKSTLGTAERLLVTQQSSSFTHSIKATCGDTSVYVSSTGSTQATEAKHNKCDIWWLPPLDFAIQNPTGQTVSATLTITTYDGSTKLGSKNYTIQYTIPSKIAPYFDLTSEDPTGVKSKVGDYVQGESKLYLNIDAHTSYGAWIKSYKTDFEGLTYATKEVTTGEINGSGTIQYTVTVTDSRDRTATETYSIYVEAYTPPRVVYMIARRCDADGTLNATGSYVAVDFTAEHSDAYDLNWTLKTKKKSESTYTFVASGGLEAGQTTKREIVYADPAYSYDIYLVASDLINEVYGYTEAPTAEVVWSLKKKNGQIVGVALGKVSEEEDVFEIDWPVKFSAGIVGNDDFVVEQGTKDGWYYRKWDSGIMECQKIVSVSTAIDKAWGTMYVGSTLMARQSYPYAFTGKPIETVSLTSSQNGVWMFAESSGNGVNGAYQTAIYNVCRPSAVSSASYYYFSFHVTGRWK